MNICGTRILEGVFENEFAIMPFSAEMSNVELHKNALCYVQPPVAITVPKSNGNLKETTFFDFKSENEEIILTALYPENDYILARFCNYSANNSSAEINSPFGKIVAETDLLGNDLKSVSDGKLEFHPWEIKTIKIIKE